MNKNLEKYIFTDIEVVSQYKSFDELYEVNPNLANLWLKKASKFNDLSEYKDITLDSDRTNKIYQEKAGLYPEFGKIVAIGVGMFIIDKSAEVEGTYKKYIKVFSSDNEVEILKNLNTTLNKLDKNKILYSFNGNSFDFPYITKRFIYTGYEISKFLDFGNAKPWEKDGRSFDLMNAIKFGNNENISMDLLCTVCGIKSPKLNMEGYMVSNVYHNETDGLTKIKDYNFADIEAMMDMSVYFDKLKDINDNE